MTTRAPFLSQRYGAYYHREVPEPDEELTSVAQALRAGTIYGASGTRS